VIKQKSPGEKNRTLMTVGAIGLEPTNLTDVNRAL
jgi:hypothetical protein